ncbi:MAG: AAA family ATPase [Desulfosalsimonadaceae bacterium]
MPANKTRLMAVANEKGGVGKTAMVVNLGAAMAITGKKVLIVDMDPQHNATSGLGVKVNDDMVNVYDLISEPADHSSLDAIVETSWENIHLLPSHPDLSGAEVELVEEDGRENRLKDAVADVINKYDFVIIDTPPSLSLLTINVFALAREVLVPCQTHPYAYGALEALFDTIEAVKEDINPDIAVVGIVPTFFDGRTRVGRDILERLQSDKRYRPYTFATPIRVNTDIAASSDAGKPVVFYKKSCNGTQDYMAVAAELARRNGEKKKK